MDDKRNTGMFLGGNAPLSATRLNDRNVSVRDTLHKGQGIFANQDFLCGETVVIGLVDSEQTERTRYSVQINWDSHILMTSPAVLINHSCNPSTAVVNNRFGAYDFVASRDILENEELTFDYATTEFEIIAMEECFCGEGTCRKTPGGYGELAEDHTLKMHGLVSDYLRRSQQTLTASSG